MELVTGALGAAAALAMLLVWRKRRRKRHERLICAVEVPTRGRRKRYAPEMSA